MAEALVIVDFQNDFTPPDGALAVPDGDRIAERVNELARSGRFELVLATRDRNPSISITLVPRINSSVSTLWLVWVQ